jgi:hypothetical protein
MGWGQRVYETDLPAFRQQGLDQWGQAAEGGRQFGYQKKLLGQREAGDNYRAQLAADASKFPAMLAQNRFDRIAPTLQGMLNDGGLVGGQSPRSPGISVGPVWGNQQIQQQVNAGRAFNDRKLGGNLRQIRQSAAGRGMAANSPLQQSLSTQARMGTAAANADLGRNVRWDAAQGNAQHVLGTQQAREQQFASRQQEDIERRKARNQYQSSIAAALAGLA